MHNQKNVGVSASAGLEELEFRINVPTELSTGLWLYVVL